MFLMVQWGMLARLTFWELRFECSFFERKFASALCTLHFGSSSKHMRNKTNCQFHTVHGLLTMCAACD